MKTFNVWKTIKLGGLKTSEDVRHALMSVGCINKGSVEAILDEPEFVASLWFFIFMLYYSMPKKFQHCPRRRTVKWTL